MNLVEKLLHCQDCEREFPFTVEEQEYYAAYGFAYEPVRCPACRATRKAVGGSPTRRRQTS